MPAADGAGAARGGASGSSRREQADERQNGDEREDQASAEAGQGGAVHVAVPWLFGRASGADWPPAGGRAAGRGAAGTVRQRQNSSKA